MKEPLPTIVVGAGRQRGALTVFPLFSRDDAAPCDAAPYVLGDDAIACGALRVREIGDGRVDRVRAENTGGKPVLLLEGQHLVGARQNRVVNGSSLVGARATLDVPVSCVEQHRWRGARDAAFSAPEQAAPLGVRRILKISVTRAAFSGRAHAADQRGIWAEIARDQRAHGVVSPTAALGDSFVARSSVIAQGTHDLAWSTGATGLAAAMGGRLVQLDLFDRPDTCARCWRRLSEALALSGADAPGARASVTAVYDGLEALASAPWRAVPPVGDGEERRAELPSGMVASMLTLGRRIVHLSAIATA